MKITIITEDSSVKLPEIKSGGRKFGRAVKLNDYIPFIDVLNNNNLNIPTDDLEKENIYKNKLKEFVRPSKLMFAGRFSEVRDLYQKLKKEYKTDLFIISGRYGLLNAESEIIPYEFYLNNYYLLKKLDEKMNFYNQLIENVNESDCVLFFLSKIFISYLFNNGLLDDISSKTKLIFITSKDFKKIITNSNNIYFHRRGVARIGNNNGDEIFKILDNLKLAIK